MPELPEVETIVRDIRPVLIGRRIASARLTHDDVLRGVTRRGILRGLAGARVEDVTRRAKHAVIRLDRGTRLVVQPGMTGSLIVHHKPLTRSDASYGVLRLPLEGGGELVYRDVRRLGTLLLLDQRGWAAYDAALGPEPLSPDFTPARLADAFGGTKQYVKKALMDQRLVVGVGNIYANEALFAAGIDPSRAANTLTPSDIGRLHHHVQRILNAAIASNGTTFRDYRTGTGASGNFQLELMVYEREGEPCRNCGTLAGWNPFHRRANHRLLLALPGKDVTTLLLPITDLAALRRRVKLLAENRPAVYRMVDPAGRVLYVGKARKLRSRLMTYFRASYPDDKAARILHAAHDIQWDYQPSEFAALLGELRLIRKHRPAYNVVDEPEPPDGLHHHLRRRARRGSAYRSAPTWRSGATDPSAHRAALARRFGSSTICSDSATAPRRCRSTSPTRATCSPSRGGPAACGTTSSTVPGPVPVLSRSGRTRPRWRRQSPSSRDAPSSRSTAL